MRARAVGLGVGAAYVAFLVVLPVARLVLKAADRAYRRGAYKKRRRR
jgi:hypothetical protein